MVGDDLRYACPPQKGYIGSLFNKGEIMKYTTIFILLLFSFIWAERSGKSHVEVKLFPKTKFNIPAQSRIYLTNIEDGIEVNGDVGHNSGRLLEAEIKMRLLEDSYRVTVGKNIEKGCGNKS